MLQFSATKKIKKNTNEEMLKLEGELTDEVAMATLAEFLYVNPGLTLKLMAGIEIYPLQELMIKGWMTSNYNMAIWGRGLSKSFSAAIFCLYWALFHPNARIVIISFAFRASRRILEQIEKFVNDKDAALLKNCFPRDMNRKNDEWKWVLPNGASILCVPLGDGSKLRGIRSDLLCCDEYGYIPTQIINEVLQPFLVSNNNIKEQLQTKELEDRLINEGKMKEEDRTIFESDIKVLYLSSATYQFEDMYKQFGEWIANTEKTDLKASYFVTRLSYEAAPPGLVNEKTIEEAKNGQTSDSVFRREYCAEFTPDSDGFYSAKKMMECTIPNGDAPCIELVGEKGANYFMSIDPSFSSAEYADYFAIVICKEMDKNGKKIPMVVHNYMVAGGDLKDHHLYIAFLLKSFNIVYISIDSSQGDNEVITSANGSKLFKDLGIELLDTGANYRTDDTSNLAKEIRQGYNFTAKKIVQKQPFTSTFQRTANEYLQACIDYKNIIFAAKLGAHPQKGQESQETDISMIKSHNFYKDMSIMDFIEHQDMLMDRLKQQCALIEVSSSSLGTQSWDLPLAFRRSKSPDRVRRDAFSALLLGNYAFKMFQDAMNVPEEQSFNTFSPMMLGRRY